MQEFTYLKTRYKLERVLGKGGMGKVYLDEDLVTRNAVAIKQILLPFFTDNNEKYIKDTQKVLKRCKKP